MEDAFIALVVNSSVVLLLASLGEMIKERAGILNLGIEGIMSLSALSAVASYIAFNDHALAILVAGITGSTLSLLHGFFSIYVKADQVLSGLGVLFIGLGLSGAIGSAYSGMEIEPMEPIIWLFDTLSILAYASAIIFYVLTRYTKLGLILDGLGDNPEGLDYLGYDVYRLRMLAVVVGGFLVGLSGAKITLSLIPVWSMGVTGGRGWIALALVISSMWNPILSIPISHVFGLLTQAGILSQVFNLPIDSRIASTTPYISTIILLTLVHSTRFKRLVKAPRTLGTPYRRRGE